MKKALSLFLALAMLCSLVTVATVTAAAEMPAIPDEMTGVAISSEADLKAISTSDTDKYYYLTQDIELTENWTPLSGFQSILDGQGYTISGLNIENYGSGDWPKSAFFITSTNATIKNLTLEGKVTDNLVSTSGNFAISAFVAAATGTAFENCISKVDITTTGTPFFVLSGGIVGQANAGTSFSGCVNYGDINISSSDANWSVAAIGGICGFTSKDLVIENCFNVGDITINSGKTYSGVGGIIGRIEDGSEAAVVEIVNCVNSGKVASTITGASGARNGGICSYAKCQKLTIKNCANIGTVSIEGTWAQGAGVIAVLEGATAATIIGCTNNGTISLSGSNYGGGMVAALNGTNGSVVGSLSVQYCANYGAIYGGSEVGGMLGFIQRAVASVDLNHCYNNGELESTSTLGAIIGKAVSMEINMTNCYSASMTPENLCGNKNGATLTDTDSKVFLGTEDLAEIVATLNTDKADDVNGFRLHMTEIGEEIVLDHQYNNLFGFSGYQITEAASGTYSIRFFTVMDNISETPAGFEITITKEDGTTTTVDTAPVTVAYESLRYLGDNGRSYYAAPVGCYYIAYALNELSAAEDLTFTVTPYATQNGETVYGNAFVVTVDAVAAAE